MGCFGETLSCVIFPRLNSFFPVATRLPENSRWYHMVPCVYIYSSLKIAEVFSSSGTEVTNRANFGKSGAWLKRFPLEVALPNWWCSTWSFPSVFAFSCISATSLSSSNLTPPYLESLLRGHLPLVYLVRFVPDEDLLNFLRGVLQYRKRQLEKSSSVYLTGRTSDTPNVKIM